MWRPPCWFSGAGIQVPGVRIAAQARGRERQQWSQPFSSGGHDMGGKLRDQGNRAVHPLNYDAITSFEVLVDKTYQR